MSQELYTSACRILTERLGWENKQRLFYRMRHDGLPRLNKPFPGAADGHVQVIDKAIAKQKPFYDGQATGGDKLCVFTSMKSQLADYTDGAADYYDFESRQNSDLEDEMETAMDYMLLTGRGVIKSTVDVMDRDEKGDPTYRILDEAIDPQYIIMPRTANDFKDADEWVHVRPFTVAGYNRLDQRYKKDTATIEKIRGSANFQSLGLRDQDIQLREGIAYTRNSDTILVFEHWKKTLGGWTIFTYSPNAPEIALRPPYGCPYKVNGKVSCPFTSFQLETKDKGWYSPRGLGDLLASWEQYQTKLLNEKADAITFLNKPLYTADQEIKNMANFTAAPGTFIPGGIRGVVQGRPPVDFDREIAYAKGEAEEVSQAPDFGIQQEGGQGPKARTATENNRIAALQQAGTTFKGKGYRRKLIKMHKHRWGLMVQFQQRSLTYFSQGEIKQLPPEALHNLYLIFPDGSPDAWNPMARFQKALGLSQATQGNPNVDQEPITKEILAAYGGGMVNKAFVPTNMKGAAEFKDEFESINGLVCPGGNRPSAMPPVLPGQDQESRLKAIGTWMHEAEVMKTPISPSEQKMLTMLIGQRLQFLKQQNPKAAAEIAKQFMQLEQMFAGGGAPTAVAPGGPPQGAQTPAPAAPAGGAKESIIIAYKDAPPDIQRQMEKAAGFVPSQMQTAPAMPAGGVV